MRCSLSCSPPRAAREAGQVIKAQRLAKLEPCPDSVIPGLMLANRDLGEAGLWTSPSTAELHLAAFEPRPADVSPAQATEARRALLEVMPGATFGEVTSLGSPGDLDGDGTADTLLLASGSFQYEGQDDATILNMLIADHGDGTLTRLYVLQGTPTGEVQLNATLDLGGDGRTELYVTGTWLGGHEEKLISVSKQREVSLLGNILCDS